MQLPTGIDTYAAVGKHANEREIVLRERVRYRVVGPLGAGTQPPVRGQHFVQIFRHLDLIIFKVGQPGPFEQARIFHNATEFSKTHRYGRFCECCEPVIVAREQSQSRSHASLSLLLIQSSSVRLVVAHQSGVSERHWKLTILKIGHGSGTA